MDIYGMGGSITQANNLSRESRNLANQARNFNGQLAANIDEVRNQKDQEGLEQQAINMYKGLQSTKSFTSTKEGTAISKAFQGGVQRGGTFLPVSFTEKFSRGPARVARDFDDVAVGFNQRAAMRRGARAVGGGATELTEIRPLPPRPPPASSTGFLGAAEEGTGAVENIPGGLLSGAAQTAEDTVNPLSSFLGGVVRDVGGSVRADTGILNDSVEVAGLTTTTDAAKAARTARASGLAAGLAASRPAQAGTAAGEAIVEGAGQAERTGQFAEFASKTGAIETGGDAIAKAAAKTAAETGLKSAGGKIALAGLGGGLDIYKDIARGGIGSDWKQEVGNIGNIVGSGLEIAGVLGMVIPGVGIGLEALGAGISIASTALETAGDYQQGIIDKDAETAGLVSQTQGIGSAQKITTAIARTQ